MIIENLIYFLLWIILSLFSVFMQILMKLSEYKAENYEVSDRYDYVIGE